MWIFKLLVILAFSNACVILRGHNYTSTPWAVQVNLDTDLTKKIAEKCGFSYKLAVNDKYFLQMNVL